VLPAALALLPAQARARLRLVQQTRAEDRDAVAAALATAGVAAEVAPFFADLPRKIADAHLVIARAGASTIAELACIGRPSLLVPLPSATDDHQTANARALAEAGGAWLVPENEFTAAALAARLETLLADPAPLAAMAAAARGFGRPEAGEKLADLVQRLAEGNA
jgi:UDP-N-acetylglucosamine--N-acetylmuramyl-(pentapeptide) pyrophosphoryl-undecaprenol N-acetylglucosamine transferase